METSRSRHPSGVRRGHGAQSERGGTGVGFELAPTVAQHAPGTRSRRSSSGGTRGRACGGWGPEVPASFWALMRAERRSAGDPYHEQCHVIFRLIFRKGVKHRSQQGLTASLTALKAAA